MKSPIQAFFDAGVLARTAFPPESRYHGLPVKTMTGPDGVPVAYLTRRFVPQPERFETLTEYRVREGERLDQIAAAQVGDAERFWFLCDANGVLNPDDLESPDVRVRITLPADVPGPGEAESG